MTVSPSLFLSLASQSSAVGIEGSEHMHTATIIVPAQNYNQDVLGDIAKGWNQFVSSGQIWALLIGLVIGYMVKSITSS